MPTDSSVHAARLLDACRSSERWLLDLVRGLVEIESPTDDKAAVDRCADALLAGLAPLRGEVTRLVNPTAGDHLRISFGTGPRRVLLLGHLDTVWPIGTLARMPIRADGDRLHGPGVLDMKAGVGLAALATRALLDVSPPAELQVVMLWTSDEETGSHTSRAVIETEARQSDAVLVLEPALAGGALKTSRKGCGQFEIVAHGVSAHAGVDPAKGVNAIRELAAQVLAVDRLRNLERGISVSVGLISGGSRPNVVPDRAAAVVDVRASTMGDADEVEAAFRALRPATPGARLEVTGGFNRPPMERTAGVASLYALASEVAGDLRMPIAEGGTGGGSDGNFTAALGVPTLDGLGALGDGAHALHEHVEIPALVPRAALIAGVMDRLGRSLRQP